MHLPDFLEIRSKVNEELSDKQSMNGIWDNLIKDNNYISDVEIKDLKNELENLNTYLKLNSRFNRSHFEIKVSEKIEIKFIGSFKKLFL